MATKTKSFRLDDETWGKFSNLCKEVGSNPSEKIIQFIRRCNELGTVPMTDEDLVTNPAITAIEKRLESRFGLTTLTQPESAETIDRIDCTYSIDSNEVSENEGVSRTDSISIEDEFDITRFVDPDPIPTKTQTTTRSRTATKNPNSKKTRVRDVIKEESTNPASKKCDGLEAKLEGGEGQKKLVGVGNP